VRVAGGKVSKIEIVGHRDLSPDLDGDGIVEPQEWIKQCPCFDAKEEYKDITKLF
jgi:N-acetylmuramoyl-L-alanine amidase